MRKRVLTVVLIAISSALWFGSAQAQQTATFTWASACSNCESSISNPGWYSDGSGIFMEGIHGSSVGAMAGLSMVGGYFCVEVGFGLEGQGNVAVNPRRSVTVETDSAAHMVLYPIDHPDTRPIKGTVVEKKRLKDETVKLTGQAVAAGYLLFPADNNASSVTVVVVVGSETFRFPFERDPNARAKFGAPAVARPTRTEQQATGSGASGREPARTSIGVPGALSTQAQLEECKKQLDLDIYPPDTCSAILGYFGPTDKLGLGPFEDGSFMVITQDAAGKPTGKTLYLPPRIRSEIALKTVAQTVHGIQSLADKEPNGIFAGMLPDGSNLWMQLLDVYCYYHPDERYTDLLGKSATCEKRDSLPDDKTMQSEFDGALVYKNNYLTFLNARVAQKLANEAPSTPPISETQRSASQAAAARTAPSLPHPVVQTGAECDKNISIAVAEDGQIVSRVPAFADKWISKNQKKYPRLCFSQVPNSQSANYLLVFSTSQSAFNGIYPTVKTSTSTNTSRTPVSGSGTVTDNYGGMWNYTYDGTATTTTTTTTTTHENLPYTDTSNTLYVHSYDQHGGLIAKRWRTLTTRQGGDAANTVGYNLGAGLGAIHFKEHLLKSAVEDVFKLAQ
jgi:hypothetical protein